MSTGIPAFSPTSSPSLDEALTRFRQDLFIPWGLPTRQRKSMFQRRHARRLQEEPITIKISETEDYTLRPMDITHLPGRRDVHRVFKMMASAKDFKNLVPFVSGLRMANIRITPGQWESLIRETHNAGRISLILECARQPGRTGLLLRNVQLVRTLYFRFHLMALQAEFKGPEVIKALNLAKQAVDIMDADLPDHAYDSPANNPKNNVGVIGALLELSSVRAINDFGGVDNGKEVVGYARKLIANLPEGYFKDIPTAESSHQDAAGWMEEASMVCGGLQKSLLVQDVAADKKLQNALTARHAEVKEALKTAVEDPALKGIRTRTWDFAPPIYKA